MNDHTLNLLYHNLNLNKANLDFEAYLANLDFEEYSVYKNLFPSYRNPCCSIRPADTLNTMTDINMTNEVGTVKPVGFFEGEVFYNKKM